MLHVNRWRQTDMVKLTCAFLQDIMETLKKVFSFYGFIYNMVQKSVVLVTGSEGKQQESEIFPLVLLSFNISKLVTPYCYICDVYSRNSHCLLQPHIYQVTFSTAAISDKKVENIKTSKIIRLMFLPIMTKYIVFQHYFF